MRKEQQKMPAYEVPKVEVVEVEVEKGFSVSSMDVDPWGDGEHLGNYETE